MCAHGQAVQYLVYSDGEALRENCMEFRMLYYGRLLSGNKPHAENKHEVRRYLSPQLERLVECKPSLYSACAREGFRWFNDHAQDHQEVIEKAPTMSVDDNRRMMYGFWTRFMSEKWARAKHGFIPLITEEMDIRCSLDILFLRPGNPGRIIERTDLDNRLKTLIDALKVPDTMDGIPAASSDPIYCLLQDDKLISEIKVVSDNLLFLPGEKTVTPNDAFLVISVTVESPPRNIWHQAFG